MSNKQFVQDASVFLTNRLGVCDKGIVFTGTGQYHVLDDLERMLMVNFDDDFLIDAEVSLFETTQLVDCCTKRSDIGSLREQVKVYSPLPVYCGEMDFINSAYWTYGFTEKPYSIFSKDERICLIDDTCIHTSVDGYSEIIDVKDVAYVGLWVSKKPYHQRMVVLGMKEKGWKTLISVEKNDASGDIVKLAVDTDWMMKAVLWMCVTLIRQGNPDIHVKVSPVLLPANNIWVAARHKIWMEKIKKDTFDDGEDN